MRQLFIALLVAAACACASRPRPTPEMLRRSANPRAVVEGRVVDPRGAPVQAVSVRGLPREKEVAWTGPSVTDAEGRFRVELIAPGEYGFVLSWKGITIVTPLGDDPSRVLLRLAPGERRAGIELVFHRDEWARALLSP
jgi:carboxypeptidase family protein